MTKKTMHNNILEAIADWCENRFSTCTEFTDDGEGGRLNFEIDDQYFEYHRTYHNVCSGYIGWMNPTAKQEADKKHFDGIEDEINEQLKVIVADQEALYNESKNS